jgi:hypothetical protein
MNEVTYLKMKERERQNLEWQANEANTRKFSVNQVLVQGHDPATLYSHLALRGQKREVEFIAWKQYGLQTL